MRANDIEWSCSLLKTVKLIAMYDFISRCILGIYTVNRKKGSTVISFIASRNISQFKWKFQTVKLKECWIVCLLNISSNVTG